MIYADIRRSWLELYSMEHLYFISTVDVIALEFSAGYGYNFGGNGEISRKRVDENKEITEKKWLFPVGVGLMNQDVGGEGESDIFTLLGVLYRFTDTFYAGITPGISFGGDFGAFISLAWTDDPDLFINSFSFFAIPASEFVMFAAFYNIAYRRFYIGPMIWVNSKLDRFSSGLFAGSYF